MELVVLIALALVVACVAIDVVRHRPRTRRATSATTQKIIVDLTKRR